MYTVSVEREFTAKHYLIGGDFGDENDLHSHEYKVQVRLTGDNLDNHGFLVNIYDINRQLDNTIETYREQTLNDLPPFKDVNPSVEHFARIFCHAFLDGMDASGIESISVRIWEYEDTWVEYSRHIT